MSCLFCKIADGTIPSKKALDEPNLLAFHDIQAQAPTHVLVIPKKHITSLAHATAEDAALLGELMDAARRVAESLGLANDGYRTVINTGTNGGQSVHHLHVHVLGGRALSWPPG